MSIAIGNGIGIPFGGVAPFDPSQIKVDGEKALLQQLLTKQAPTIAGIVYDERKNKGTARPVQLGRCYLFDGTNDYVATPVIPSTSGSIEVEFIKGASTNKFLGGARDSTDTRCILGYDSLNKPIGGIGSVSGTTIIGTTTLVTGTKYTLKLTWNGSFVFLYVNGVLEYSGVQVGSVGTVRPIYFGTFNDAGTPSGAYASDKVLTFKIYNGSTLQNFYKCDEQVGAMSYDSVGDKHGIIMNATLSTFHSTQDVYSYQNEVGHSLGTSLSPSGGTLWLMGGSSVNSYSGDILMKTRITDVVGYSFIYFATGTTINNPIASLGTHWIYLRNGILRTQSRTDVELTHSAFAIGDEIEIRRIGTTVAVYKNNVLVRTFTNSSTGALYVCASIHSDSSSESGIVTINSVYEIFNLVALTARKTYYIPRNESIPTQDVLGNTLTYTGQVPYNGLLKGSNCILLNGTNQYGATGLNMNTLCQNTFSVDTIVSPTDGQGTTSVIFGSSDNATFGTQGTDSNNGLGIYVLTTGKLAVLYKAGGNFARADTASVIFTDGSQTALRKFRFTLTAGSGITILEYINGAWVNLALDATNNGLFSTNSVVMSTFNHNVVGFIGGKNTAGTAYNFFGGKVAFLECLNSSGTSLVQHKMSCGTGTVLCDSSSNNLHGALYNAPTWSTQDQYHPNIVEGFRSYLLLTGSGNYVTTGDLTGLDNDWSLSFKLRPTVNTSLQYPIGFASSSDKGIGITAGGLPFLYDGVSLLASTGSAIPTTSFTTIGVTKSGTTYNLYINGVLNISGTRADIDIAKLYLGVRGDAFGACGGNLFDFRVYSSTLSGADMLSLHQLLPITASPKILYNCTELSGSTLTDSSGNTLNGTITGSTTRVKVPALNSTTDVFGYPLTNPAGAYHNGAETTINFTGGVLSPVAVINSWETAWAFNTARTNPEFKRTLTSGGVAHRADRFLAYRDALSATNLSKVTKYVATKTL